ncbi:type VII secretion target [Amycolatopsis sp. NPDC049159]|uniref:type VII secretion target n=1 Tax=Amycolatopsis sp. NPDC049159 TaxID=3157210 RepID=UPI0033FBDAC5
MSIEDGYTVEPAALGEIAAAAGRVAHDTAQAGDAVADASPLRLPEGDWAVGDEVRAMIAPWEGSLHALAENIRDLGRNIDKASKLYAGAEKTHSEKLRAILG